ncbi:LOB domain-containing protein 4 [Dionaea muscipula]
MKDGVRKQGVVMSPCAACKLLRRKCAADCIFAPYFPADEPQKFATVHRVFGASNVNKMLQELPMQQRSDAVSSMVYEANARVRDPVYGCVGAISSLQQQINELQKQLALAQAEMVRMRLRDQLTFMPNQSSTDGRGNVSAFLKLPSDSKCLLDLSMIDNQSDVVGESLWSC